MYKICVRSSKIKKIFRWVHVLSKYCVCSRRLTSGKIKFAVGVTLGWPLSATTSVKFVHHLICYYWYIQNNYCQFGRSDVKKLFEFWCEVKPTRGIDRGSVNRGGGGAAATPAGVIIESFPEGFRDKEVLNGIPSFAFPCDLIRCVCYCKFIAHCYACMFQLSYY